MFRLFILLLTVYSYSSYFYTAEDLPICDAECEATKTDTSTPYTRDHDSPPILDPQ